MNTILFGSPLETVLIILCIVLPIAGLVCGAVGGIYWKKISTAKKFGDAKKSADKWIEDAQANARAIKKEAILEAKEEVQKIKSEQDREFKERRAEIQRTEQRIIQKEESLDRKEQSVDKKLENLDIQRQNLKNRETEQDKKAEELARSQQKIDEELNNMQQRIASELERVAQLTREDAKQQLIESIETEAKKDAAILVRDIENAAKEEGQKKAKEIIGSAIQRCATDHSAEITVSVIPLPSDDMKGRIIGREGRNIRALESATGIDLIIDDTPEAVILSGFDPVRREVARITLERLIGDGRIHPARIEEMVEKVRKEVDVIIKEAGESAMFEVGVFGLNPELVKILGRLKYRTSYGQNVLRHSVEVSLLAGLMAAELGADVAICKRAGLLHDIGKATDHETEGTHISIGVDIAKKYKENKDVIHCIAAHHNDVEPQTLEAVLVQAADGISGGRPGARRESLENYVKRLEKLEGIANSFAGVEKSFAIQAGREVRIVVKPEEVDDSAAVFMAKEIAKKIESEMEYPGQIKVNVIREMRSVEFAK